MNKIDGSNLVGWVTQIEHHLSLHIINNDLMKLNMGFLYLDLECCDGGNGIRKLVGVIFLGANL
jgi:hypothetical protein